MHTQTRYGILVAVLIALALGGAVGWWVMSTTHEHELEQRTDEQGKVYWTCPMHPEVRQDHPGNCPICGMKLVKREEQPPGQAPAGERKVLYWYDPMKPEVHFDKPGKSPFMDMQLVPKYADEGGGDGAIVRIDPVMAQNLGVRTATLQRGAFSPQIDAVGAVAVDERRIAAVSARTSGWVEVLDVRAEGEPVQKGQRIAALYSPELYAAMQELQLAQDSKDPRLVEAARQRLRLLGGSPGSGSRSSIYAPQNGYVLELSVREGEQVMPGTPLMRIADLSSVWMLVDVPEAQAASLHAGQHAQARLRALPGRVFEGSVDYVYPLLDPQTRTLRVRLVFANPEGMLRPGMYADVIVHGQARQEALLAPAEAVIRTGRRNIVIVAEGDGRFRPTEVQLGAEYGDQVVILSGLRAGQDVVVSGQFLIDSEASLLGVYNRMEPPLPSPPDALGQHDRHEGHDGHDGHAAHAAEMGR